jgi:hypothetical protein
MRQAEFNMATVHRKFAASVGLAAMLAGTAAAPSAELRDPLSMLTSVNSPLTKSGFVDSV